MNTETCDVRPRSRPVGSAHFDNHQHRRPQCSSSFTTGSGGPECHHVRMPRSRRSPNRITDDSLVDDAGYEWYRVNKDLRRDAIARLLGDPDVRVGVHAGRARLRWIADVERERVWSEEIEPNFHDHADAIATFTPRQLPFHGTLWRRRGKQLLIFDDFD